MSSSDSSGTVRREAHDVEINDSIYRFQFGHQGRILDHDLVETTAIDSQDRAGCTNQFLDQPREEHRDGLHPYGFAELDDLKHEDWIASETPESLQLFINRMNEIENNARNDNHEVREELDEDSAADDDDEMMSVTEQGDPFSPENMDAFGPEELELFDAAAAEDFISRGYGEDNWVDYEAWVGRKQGNSDGL